MRQLLGIRSRALPLAIAACAGVLLGLACWRWSPVHVLAVMAIIGLMVVTLKRPEIAMLGILVATSSIVHEATLPLISIGVGSLHIPDLLLLGLMGIFVVRRLSEREFSFVHTPLDVPLLTFYACALVATALAIGGGTVEGEEARRSLRVVTYYLIFFVITNLVREESQLDLFIRGFLALATIVAGAMVLQVVIGEAGVFLPGKVVSLQTAGQHYRNILRITPPGQSLVMVGFILTTVNLTHSWTKPASLVRLPQWSLLGLGLLLTFNRSYWIAVAVALLGCAAVGGSLLRRRTIVLGLAALLTIAVFLLLASRVPGSPITLWAEAFLDRLVTLGQGETLHEDSLRWRYVENSYALKQITSHPFFGLGLGAHYRPFDPKLDVSGMAWDARGYIHNGHLWIMVSIGLLGYASWVWLWLRFMQHGISQWHRLPHPGAGGRVLALTMAFGGAMLASLTSPLPMEWFWVPVLGMMMGIAEVTLRLGSQTQSGFLQ